MAQRLIRWTVLPVLLFALTGCTQLANADGFTPTRVPSQAPSETANTSLESSGEYAFGLPEEATEALTKESLPDPAGFIPDGVTNAVSLSDLEATNTHRFLRLPKPVNGGTLTVLFACVDGDIDLGNDVMGGMGSACDGSAQAILFAIEQAFNSLKIELTVSPEPRTPWPPIRNRTPAPLPTRQVEPSGFGA